MFLVCLLQLLLQQNIENNVVVTNLLYLMHTGSQYYAYIVKIKDFHGKNVYQYQHSHEYYPMIMLNNVLQLWNYSLKYLPIIPEIMPAA